jgi:hypothetical protein
METTGKNGFPWTDFPPESLHFRRIVVTLPLLVESWKSLVNTLSKVGWKATCSRAVGLLDSYKSFIYIIDSMVNQHAKWLEKCAEVSWRQEVASPYITLFPSSNLLDNNFRTLVKIGLLHFYNHSQGSLRKHKVAY